MLGVQLADRVEVRSGLKEGERIVAAGVFLLDSESRLEATGAGGHNHAEAPRQGPCTDPMRRPTRHARRQRPARSHPARAPRPHGGQE